jgi:hypothetical protein
MAYSRDKLKARREAAKRERDIFQPLLDEAYQYAIPFRKSTRNTGTGEKRVNQAFDHTAIDSAFRFAGKLQQDLMAGRPAEFRARAGPAGDRPAEREQLSAALARSPRSSRPSSRTALGHGVPRNGIDLAPAPARS